MSFPVRRFISEEALGPFPFDYEPSSPVNAVAHLKDMASRAAIAPEVNIRTRVLWSPPNGNGPKGDFSK